MISTNSDGHISLPGQLCPEIPWFRARRSISRNGLGLPIPRRTGQIPDELNIFLDMRPSKGYNFCLRYLS
jgi:hypothetical protein